MPAPRCWVGYSLIYTRVGFCGRISYPNGLKNCGQLGEIPGVFSSDAIRPRRQLLDRRADDIPAEHRRLRMMLLGGLLPPPRKGRIGQHCVYRRCEIVSESSEGAMSVVGTSYLLTVICSKTKRLRAVISAK